MAKKVVDMPPQSPEKAQEYDPMAPWREEKDRQNARINELKRMQATVVGQIDLLNEDLQNIKLELAELGGMSRGGDYALRAVADGVKENEKAK